MIEFTHLVFSYPETSFRLEVAGLQVAPGERVVITGPSGAGKTTLLHLAAGILLPTAGTIAIDGWPISQQTDSVRRDYRIRNVGLVFQEFELLEYLTVWENLLLPYRINRTHRLDMPVKHRAEQLAESLGIQSTLNRHPAHLSQGERQRVAICRALLTQPKIILADEPTGNLDPSNRRIIIDLLINETSRHRSTLLMVTHDHSVIDRFDRAVDLEQLSSANGDRARVP